MNRPFTENSLDPAATAPPAAGEPVAAPRRSAFAIGHAFAHRGFLLFWCGAFASHIGFWVRQIAKSWLLYDLAGQDARWLGYDAFAIGVPVLLLLPIGGALADRIDRRWIMGMTCAANAVIWLTLAVLVALDAATVWHILATSFLSGVLEGFRVAAYQAMYPALVSRADIPNAIALNSAGFQSSRIIGPALGGAVYAAFGPPWAFALFAAGCVVMVAMMLVIREGAAEEPQSLKAGEPEIRTGRTLAPTSGSRAFRLSGSRRSAPSRRESMAKAVVGGFRYVRGRADIVTMFALVVLAGLLGAPLLTMLPALVREGFGGDVTAFSGLMSLFGVGALCASLMLAARSRRRPTPWRAYVILMAMGVCIIAIGLSASYLLTMSLIVAAGLAWTGVMVRVNTAIQHSLPDDVRGRVMSLYMLAIRAGVPVGSLAAGFVAEAVGVRQAFWLFGAAMLAAAPAVFIAARWRDVAYVHAEPGGPAGGEPRPAPVAVTERQRTR